MAADRLDPPSRQGGSIAPGADWRPRGEFEDIRYETAEGIAKITIDRPEVRNAFRPQTRDGDLGGLRAGARGHLGRA